MTEQELADRLEILELMAAYCRAADGDEAAEFAEFFTEDGVMNGSKGPVQGRPALVELIKASLGTVVHTTTDHIIDLDGDAARHTCNVIVYTRAPAGTQPSVRLVARYVDELKRTPDGWRIARRDVDRGAYPPRSDT